MLYWFLSLAFFLCGCLCGCKEQQPFKRELNSPSLPTPIVNQPYFPSMQRDNEEAKRAYPDILEHPWLKRQPEVKEISWEIVNDLRSINELSIPFSLIESEYLKLQKEIEPLEIKWPENLYQVINIPQSTTPTPVPFRIYRRTLLGTNCLGFPIYLDLRVFEDQSMKEILEWHFKLLKSEFEAYNPNTFVGRGDRNCSHFDPSHGLATYDRGVFLAAYPHQDKLYLLFADAPWPDLASHLETLLKITDF